MRKLWPSLALSVILSPLPAAAQQLQFSAPYRPPTAEEWQAAGLDLADLPLAQRYEVTVDDWKDMEASRRARQTAGWVCIGVALLTPLIEVTLIYGADIAFDDHPELEVWITTNVAAAATLISGVVLLVSAPDPDDFRRRWEKRQLQKGLSLAPSPGGVGLAWRF